MSKIFEAYKIKAGETADVTQEVSRAGSVSLFPTPKGKQTADFSQLANRILGLRLDNRGTVVSFASTVSGEGASFVSYNAAQVLAHTYKQKVCWIDGNFLRPQVKLMEAKMVTFGSLLQDSNFVGNLIVDRNPFLIPSGSNLVSAMGHLADKRYKEMLNELTARFDFVILDLPPVLDSTDAALMAAGSDGLLLVVEQQFLKREIVEYGIQVLREKGVQVLGSVINRRQFVLPKVIYDRL